MTDARDSEVLALQIGRPLRATSTVLRRCHLGLPIVAEVPPILDTGEPFPTRYWLTCPLAHRRIARIEARGGVREAQAELEADPRLARALAEAQRSIRARARRFRSGGRASPAERWGRGLVRRREMPSRPLRRLRRGQRQPHRSSRGRRDRRAQLRDTVCRLH